MSKQYNEYLKNHKQNVADAFYWISDNVPDLLTGDYDYERQICADHDSSKSEEDEYKAYDDYFNGPDQSYLIKQKYNAAWLNHIHKNNHHWQHWILHNDDEEEGTVCLEMSKEALFEMIADWLSFGIISGNPGTILDFYEKKKNYMLLHDATRKQLEKVLELISEKVKKDSGPLL